MLGNVKILVLICGWLNLWMQKKIQYKWTCTVQTHMVQGSAVYTKP